MFLPLFGLINKNTFIPCENIFSQPYSSLVVGIIFEIKSLITYQITISLDIIRLSHVIFIIGSQCGTCCRIYHFALGSLFKKKVGDYCLSYGNFFSCIFLPRKHQLFLPNSDGIALSSYLIEAKEWSIIALSC